MGDGGTGLARHSICRTLMEMLPLALHYHLSLGGDISQQGHGDVNFGVQGELFSAELQTDTLDLRWTPSGEHGRAWLGLRGAAFAAQMLITPWSGGAPDPANALNAAYVGLDGGGLRYGPAGSYAGLQFAARHYFFSAQDATTRAVPDARTVYSPELVLGWWKPFAEVRLLPGCDLSPTQTWAPHLYAEAHWRPQPQHPGWVELRGGIAAHQDDLISTRIGGLNPYVIPLAGAAWAEFHANDFVALRLGPSFGPTWTHGAFWGGPLLDVVWFSEQTSGPIALQHDWQREIGLGLRTHIEHKKFFGDLSGGWSPTLLRQPSYGAWSIWLRLGLQWGA